MTPQSEKKLFLLDAFALIFRAFYGFGRNPLINSKGQNVSAISGFTSTLWDLLKKEKPTHIAVVFDTKAKTKRTEIFAEYKANRQDTPEDIIMSVPYIKDIIKGFNIPVLGVDGYEADDVIGTLAKQAEKEGYQVYMVTPDKDFAQLVSENIYMYKPSRSGKGVEILGIPEVKEKWEVKDPDQVVDILGMWGDAVDNIPGIPGIGEKTAKKFIKLYGSMEGLYENVEELKGKQKEKVAANKEQAFLSKQLARIDINVPIQFDEKTFIIDPLNREVLGEIFANLEFRTLGRRILGNDYKVVRPQENNGQLDMFAVNVLSRPEIQKVELGNNIKNTEHDYKLVQTEEEINDLIQLLLNSKEYCFDTETTGLDPNEAELVGMSFAVEAKKAFYIPISENQEEAKTLVQKFKPVFEHNSIIKIAQNVKYDLLMLKWYGIELATPYYDTMLAHYILYPESRHNMDLMSENVLGYSPMNIEELIGKKGKNQKNMRSVDLEKVKEYAAEDADITFQLKQKLEPQIKIPKVKKVLEEIEFPLVNVLAEMEYAGVAIDKEYLKKYSGEITTKLEGLSKQVFETAGVEFNLDSPKQLGEVLFDKMEIPYKGKKTKTKQYSTNEEVLLKIEKEYPIVKNILEYREFKKLKSTYVDALPQLINPKTGRVHTSYAQAVAATGRLSSNNPNLQNIPIRRASGREVRKAFIARNDDYRIISADYSQIELRIMAACSKEDKMIHDFKNGLDIHSTTAARVFGVHVNDVDSTMRSKAKMVNFGIIYGISPFGLAQRLNISRTEAKDIIESYLEKYPAIKKFMNNSVNFARENGFVETLMGRRRYLKDINSRNYTVRGYAERNAINSPIQGSAADMIKVAMINLQTEMKKRELKSKMTLQVHDELIFDAHISEIEELIPLVHHHMENAMPLDVPIVVESGQGLNWLEAH